MRDLTSRHSLVNCRSRRRIELTSPTQTESHRVWQQYGSSAQISVAHGVHEDESFLPVLQMECLQVFVVPESFGAEESATAPVSLGVAASLGVPASAFAVPESFGDVVPASVAVEVPAARAAPFGVPHPVGPS